jgi:SAM-dependent methyltransferase/uncharacterized protein YbaR (Trm112 family)
MKHSALDFLVCNVCHSALSLSVEEERAGTAEALSEVITGNLKCTKCTKTFPIRKGVPRFVDETVSSAQNVETGERFGIAWKEFPRLDSRYREQFFDWIYPVDPNFVKGKVVLEGGCGKGRHAELIADAEAEHIFAVDIGEAVDVTFENVGHRKQIHVIQCDICALPFKPVFDFAFSVGVLHHMESPQLGFQSLVDVLKPNGAICAWVYGRENNWWLINIINPVRTAITAHMPAQPLKMLAALLAAPVFLYAKLFASPYMKLKEKMPLPDLFYGAYLSYIARFDFNEIHHIVFDHLVAPVSNYIPGDEVQCWFEKANFPQPIIRWHNKNSWSGFADRNPATMLEMRNRIANRSSILLINDVIPTASR